MVKVFAIDIDGVLTDGKVYISKEMEFKTICYQDLDALEDIRRNGVQIAIISGENNEFTEFVKEKIKPDFVYLGCKCKGQAIEDILRKTNVSKEQICYIGDGKYDIPAVKKAGISLCPANAIDEIKECVNTVLVRKGGEGCIAEACFLLYRKFNYIENKIRNRIIEHERISNQILCKQHYIKELARISYKIVECYRKGGKLLLCGNGGSAADAQHIAAELVSRFYMERKALSAEALNVNSSVITAIGNDYNYSKVFAREVEAKGSKGDILIGISTSGKSENVIAAFRVAQELEITTILFTGILEKEAEILNYTDYLLSVPSKDTPRIQEMHILSGHVMCEIIENEIFRSGEKENE